MLAAFYIMNKQALIKRRLVKKQERIIFSLGNHLLYNLCDMINKYLEDPRLSLNNYDEWQDHMYLLMRSITSSYGLCWKSVLTVSIASAKSKYETVC